MRTNRRAADGQDWTAHGACSNLDPDGFFVQGADQQRVKALCGPCPVRTQCLADALQNRIEFGVWGGMTERERRRMLRQYPDVSDWFDVLEAACRQQEQLVQRPTGS
ncbi:WhiB family transcriptional regulator [Devriesea agamarum]|uniref:WhiB family transcriptional regulator n=1 Tax=Devriesea agamarum TaxID=472569 RepID=UPI00071CF59F|nr:WhiB family transcriptional regulator [Devriesea agamarum]